MIRLAYSNVAQYGDFTQLKSKNLDTDDGLETACIVSLFTNARAPADAGVDPLQSPGGWWGSQFLDDTGAELGSKLWLTRRLGLNTAGMLKCDAWVRESLQWLIDAGIAASVNSTTSRYANGAVKNAAQIAISIQRSSNLNARFERVWKVTFGY